MPTLVDQLRALLMPTPVRKNGQVIAVINGKVHVATDSGVRILDNNSATEYRTGDAVTLVAGELAGKQTKDSARPVFFV